MIDPEFVSFGFLHIRWYGVMAAAGVLAAYWLMIWRSRRYGFKTNDVSDMVFWGMISAMAGARMLYVIRFWDEQFSGRILDVVKIYEGGLVFLGGFALAVLVMLGLCRMRHWNVGDVSALFAPALALGHAFGRLGCLLNGCCHGFRYDGACSVHYPFLAWGTFPLQGIAACCNVLLALFLLWLEKKGGYRRSLFLTYMVLYSMGRFCLEFGRGDYPSDQLWHTLTPAQVTCLWLFPCSLAAWLWVQGRSRHAR